MILADTSAWIEFDRGTDSPVALRLRSLIEGEDLVALTEPVMMEVLIGARNDQREAELRRLLRRAHLLHLRLPTDFDNAVGIYRRCRAQGVTPRGAIDCLIASVALRNRATLLAHDADMDRVAHVMGIQMDPASLRA